MTTNYLPYIITIVFLVIYSAAIAYKLNASLGSENEMLSLRRMIYSYYVVLFTDIIWAMAEDQIVVLPDLVSATVNGIMLCGTVAGCFFWHQFVTYRLSPASLEKKHIQIISVVPLIASLVLDIISIFTGWVFYIDTKNHYAYGPMFAVQAASCYAYLVIPTWRSIRRALHTRSKSQRGEYLIYASYMVPPLISGFLEDVMPTVPILELGMFMVIHILFLSIQDRQIYNDALTGLNNRRRLDSFLEEAIPDATDNRPICVFMTDINKFKSINDTYGHVEGDKALRCAGEALSQISAKYGAFAARYGGDEFCMVAFGKEDAVADIVADLQATLAQVQAEDLPGRGYTLSMSVGCAVCADPNTSPETLIELVDKRLYEDKNRWHAARG